MDATQLKEIAEAWRNEIDEGVVADATENISEYPPEIRVIIRDEALRRELISCKVNAGATNDTRLEFSITKRGQQALSDWRETRPKAVVSKLTRMIVALIAAAVLMGLVSAVFGLREGAITGASTYGLYLAIDQILRPREESGKPEPVVIVSRRGKRSDKSHA